MLLPELFGAHYGGTVRKNAILKQILAMSAATTRCRSVAGDELNLFCCCTPDFLF